ISQQTHTINRQSHEEKQTAIINVHVGSKRIASEIVKDISDMQNRKEFRKRKLPRNERSLIMYEFVDTIESAKNTPLSLQTIFNGNNLDKLLSDENGRFTTTSVGGRGPIAKRLITKELPGTHGEKEKDYT